MGDEAADYTRGIPGLWDCRNALLESGHGRQGGRSWVRLLSLGILVATEVVRCSNVAYFAALLNSVPAVNPTFL